MAAEERETTIVFTEADTHAQVYTCNRKFKSRLKKLGFEVQETDRLGGELYEIPREYLQIRKPKTVTDEGREEARERLKKIREEHGIGEFSDKAGTGTKKKKKTAAKRKKAAPEPEEDEDEEELEDEEEELEDEEDELEDDEDEEEVEVVKPKRKPAKKTAAKKTTRRRPAKK